MSHIASYGKVKLNSVSTIPHIEMKFCDEEIAAISTQYPSISGSLSRMSRVNGGVQLKVTKLVS